MKKIILFFTFFILLLFSISSNEGIIKNENVINDIKFTNSTNKIISIKVYGDDIFLGNVIVLPNRNEILKGKNLRKYKNFILKSESTIGIKKSFKHHDLNINIISAKNVRLDLFVGSSSFSPVRNLIYEYSQWFVISEIKKISDTKAVIKTTHIEFPARGDSVNGSFTWDSEYIIEKGKALYLHNSRIENSYLFIVADINDNYITVEYPDILDN